MPTLKEMKNHSLCTIYEAIDSGRVQVLSFDLFDTLVWRKLPDPSDLFLILGDKLKKEGWLIAAVTAENYAQMRSEAEQAARFEKRYALQTTEITLQEIYWQLQNVFVKLSTEQMLAGKKIGIYESDVSELVKYELDLEKQLLQYDEDLLQLLLYAQAKNIACILVSDTYFEECDIFYLIDKKLSAAHFLNVFISCEYGVNKANGLFSIVTDTIKVAPHTIFHIGDNYETDIVGSSKSGLQNLHYKKTYSFLDEVIHREWSSRPSKRKHFLDRDQGDFGITSLRRKIHHYCPYSEKKEEHFFWNYGTSILGPVLFGFIHWIYVRCKEMHTHQVFCLMREGKLYANLIRRFAPYFPSHSLEAKQLWVSRLFITHAAMGFASRKELVATMNAFLEHFTIEHFCIYLGLDISKMQNWSNYRYILLEDPAMRKNFIHYLMTQSDLRQVILENATAKRQRFVTYLKKIVDIRSEAQMTLVDVGWNGTAQKCLQQILQLSNSPTFLHGLYLGTAESANTALLHGTFCEGYLFKGGFPNWCNAHKKGCFVLEQTATAETGIGPLEDIDSEGKVVNTPQLIPSWQKKQAQIVQEGIFAFFDYAGRSIQSGAIFLEAHAHAFEEQLRNILLRSMMNTTATEALKFGPWLHEHGPFTHLTQVIGKNHYYDHFIRDMLPVAAFKESGLNWPAAYAAKHSKYLTLTSEALWLKTMPPECFLSEDNIPLKIFVDTGKSFSKKATQVIQLRSNPNRNFYTLAKLFSTYKTMKRIQLMLDISSALIRIKSLRLVLYDQNTPEPETVVFFESTNPSATLNCVSGKQIDFNTYYSTEHLKLVHSFENASIYHIKLKLCCEVFKMNSWSSF